MIAYISGTVRTIEEKALVIETNGVGYRVRVAPAVLSTTAEGAAIELDIYHHMSDSNQELYGFADAKELEYFRLLLNVPSVGVRTARGILDAAPPAVLEGAITAGDAGALPKIPGVGKKTAERMVLELKGKVTVTGEHIAVPMWGEAIEALVSIGFSRTQAQGAIQNLPKEITTVEEAVKEALKTR